MQRAMPTTVGTWLGSFAQGWRDSTKMLDGALLGPPFGWAGRSVGHPQIRSWYPCGCHNYVGK